MQNIITDLIEIYNELMEHYTDMDSANAATSIHDAVHKLLAMEILCVVCYPSPEF